MSAVSATRLVWAVHERVLLGEMWAFLLLLLCLIIFHFSAPQKIATRFEKLIRQLPENVCLGNPVPPQGPGSISGEAFCTTATCVCVFSPEFSHHRLLVFSRTSDTRTDQTHKEQKNAHTHTHIHNPPTHCRTRINTPPPPGHRHMKTHSLFAVCGTTVLLPGMPGGNRATREDSQILQQKKNNSSSTTTTNSTFEYPTRATQKKTATLRSFVYHINPQPCPESVRPNRMLGKFIFQPEPTKARNSWKPLG